MMTRVADRQGELADALAELTRRNQHVWACVEALIDVVDPVPGGDEAQGSEGSPIEEFTAEPGRYIFGQETPRGG